MSKKPHDPRAAGRRFWTIIAVILATTFLLGQCWFNPGPDPYEDPGNVRYYNGR